MHRGVEIVGDAARYDTIHHQPMSESGIRGAQHLLAQDAAMGVHERKRGVIADSADVAEMICQPFKLSHQRAQIVRAGGSFDVQRRLDARAKAMA